MSAVAHKNRILLGHSEPAFEHTNRRGKVSLLPLTRETQRFLANDVVGRLEQAEPSANCEVQARNSQPKSACLTARELQVFDLLISGHSNKMIAHELAISPRTVEVHRARLMQKLGVRNAAALVRMALTAA